MDNNLKKIADRLKSVDKAAISVQPDDDDDFGKSLKYHLHCKCINLCEKNQPCTFCHKLLAWTNDLGLH